MDYEDDDGSGREIPLLQFGARRVGGWVWMGWMEPEMKEKKDRGEMRKEKPELQSKTISICNQNDKLLGWLCPPPPLLPHTHSFFEKSSFPDYEQSNSLG